MQLATAALVRTFITLAETVEITFYFLARVWEPWWFPSLTVIPIYWMVFHTKTFYRYVQHLSYLKLLEFIHKHCVQSVKNMVFLPVDANKPAISLTE